MPQNALEIKEKILWALRKRGPSLPVHIAKETGLSILFAGAFLSELVADKKIKFTDMKVGSSPIYFLNDHAPMLERFSQHLNSREKDAFLLLREKKFLKDREQSPVIRVALRAIKDFAVSFIKNGEVIWRYYAVPESEFLPETKPEIKEEIPAKHGQDKEAIAPEKEEEKKLIKLKIHIPKKEESRPVVAELNKKEETKEQQKELGIFEKPGKPKKQGAKKEAKKKKAKIDDNFFNKVKEWITGNAMEIIDIRNFNKNELHLKVKKDGKEHLLVAYNKKRISDSDLIKANKKARELGLGYAILSFGELQKKMSDIIDAAKNLTDIKKIE